MAFEERLQASFRGVHFYLEQTEGTSGRRAIPHQYPKRNLGYTEDNGAVLQHEQISARVIGSDYVDQLNALLAALNTEGVGELIHPWFGIRQVQVGNVTHKLLMDTDQTATLNFEVYEAGTNLFPGETTDTAQAVSSAADTARDATISAFQRKVAQYEDATTIAAGLGEMFDTYLDDLDELTYSLPHLPDAMKEWVARLERTKSSVGNLLAYPGDLASETLSLLEDVKDVVTDPVRALSVYDSVRRRWDGDRAELAATGGLKKSIETANNRASSVQADLDTDTIAAMHNNVAAMNTLVANSAVVEKAAALASADFTYNGDDNTINSLTGTERQSIVTGSQLTNMGNATADELGDAAADAVENGDSDVWRSFRTLRHTVIADTRERATQLPSLRNVTPSVTLPVALLAWQQTGDTTNRGLIIRRNGLVNPAFIVAGTDVEIIDD